MRLPNVEALGRETERRALVLTLHLNPHWSLADLVAYLEAPGERAATLGELTVLEIAAISKRVEQRLVRARRATGAEFDELMHEVLVEARRPVAASFPQAPPWRTCADTWMVASPQCWGPVVEDARRLWSQRVVEIVAGRAGATVPEAADRLLGMKSQRRYLLLGSIARTRRSVVFAAVDQLLAREVALKVLRDRDDDHTWRTIAEVQAMTRFDQPNVVRVHDFGDDGGWLYATMELCDTDLEAWRGGKSWQLVLERLAEVGVGLATVHGAGLVHGDVKPENILLRNGVAKLGDFGLAGTPGWSACVGGTPGFIAPEVGDGRRSPAGDVFAFAVTAWTCLTGRSPFGEPPSTADSSAAALVLVERAREGMIDSSTAAVPRPVLAALRRAMDPAPDRRPTLAELLTQLDALRSAGSVGRLVWSWRLGSGRSPREHERRR